MSSERSPFTGGSSGVKNPETAEVAKRDRARVGRLPTHPNYTYCKVAIKGEFNGKSFPCACLPARASAWWYRRYFFGASGFLAAPVLGSIAVTSPISTVALRSAPSAPAAERSVSVSRRTASTSAGIEFQRLTEVD